MILNMLFNKGETSAIKEEVIKKTLSGQDGKALVYINITYPKFELKDKDKLKQNAQPYYEKNANSFLHFAENELLERAKKLIASDNFHPLGAVMRYTNSFENKLLLSIFCDVSIFDGIDDHNSARSAQLWNKEKGYIYSFSDVFSSEARSFFEDRFCSEGNSGILSSEDYKKAIKHYFCEDNFFITDRAAGIFYPAERLGCKQGIKTFFVEKELLKEKKLLKIEL